MTLSHISRKSLDGEKPGFCLTCETSSVFQDLVSCLSVYLVVSLFPLFKGQKANE